MSKILQKSNKVPSIIQQVEQQHHEGNEHKAIIHKQFDEIVLGLRERVNKVNQLEQELQQTKDFYEQVIEEIEKKLSGILIK